MLTRIERVAVGRRRRARVLAPRSRPKPREEFRRARRGRVTGIDTIIVRSWTKIRAMTKIIVIIFVQSISPSALFRQLDSGYLL